MVSIAHYTCVHGNLHPFKLLQFSNGIQTELLLHPLAWAPRNRSVRILKR